MPCRVFGDHPVPQGQCLVDLQRHPHSSQGSLIIHVSTIPLCPFLPAGLAQHKHQLAIDSGQQQRVVEGTGKEDLTLEETLDPVWNVVLVQNGGMT